MFTFPVADGFKNGAAKHEQQEMTKNEMSSN